MKHLLEAHSIFEKNLDFHWRAAPTKKQSVPLGWSVDAVLLDISVNDASQLLDAHTDMKHLKVVEALLLYLKSLPADPSILFVDTPSQVKWPVHEHTLNMKLAQLYNLSMVDVLEGDLEIAQRLPELFGKGYKGNRPKRPGSPPEAPGVPIAPLLDIYRGANGQNHFNAVMHEWVAAISYYTLFAPLFGKVSPLNAHPATQPPPTNDAAAGAVDRNGFYLKCESKHSVFDVLLCHLANGVHQVTSFDETPGYPLVNQGWVHGADVPNKVGWLACENFSSPTAAAAQVPASPKLLTFRVDRCSSATAFLITYLRSYTDDMGSVNVTVSLHERNTVTVLASEVVDSHHPQSRVSVPHTHVLPFVNQTSPFAHGDKRNRKTGKQRAFLEVDIVLLAPHRRAPHPSLGASAAHRPAACNECVECAAATKGKFKLHALGCT